MRRHANNSKLTQIQEFFINSTNEYFLNKCTSGIQNWMTYKQAETSAGTIDDFYTFEVFGKHYFQRRK